MPNVRGTDNSARKQRPSLTEAQSAKRKQGYADKQDEKNKKAKFEEKIAKAGFFMKKAGVGRSNQKIRRMLFRMLLRMLLPIWVRPRDPGRGMLMPF